MKWIYIGGFMILIGTILAIVVDWRLAIILFLIVQGNTIVQHANDEINKKNHDDFDDCESDFYDDDIYKR